MWSSYISFDTYFGMFCVVGDGELSQEKYSGTLKSMVKLFMLLEVE